MKTLRGKLLVKAYLNQKEAIVITGEKGNRIELWVGKKFVENYRQRNPVICECVSNNSEFDYIKEGDKLIVHHNLLSEPSHNPRCIEWNKQTGEALFMIPANENIFCKINDDGTVEPICNNLIAERVDKEIKTTLIVIPDSAKKKHDDRVRVVAVAPEVDHTKAGQTILIENKADYEICYTYNKKEHSIIRVWGEYVIGHFN